MRRAELRQSDAERLAGRFEDLRRLGEGGFGIVYSARDLVRGERVAVKCLVRMDPGALFRFKNEFRSLADVAHPNLVRLHELLGSDDVWYLTMELVEGRTLIEHVCGTDVPQPDPERRAGAAASAGEVAHDVPPTARHVRAPASAAVDVTVEAPAEEAPSSGTRRAALRLPRPDVDKLRESLRGLVAGVHALHDVGKLHRDLKPSNVLVTSSGRVVILDFGLVAELAEDGMHRSMTVTGTPAYMAPEQMLGRAVSAAADWYAVGVMLYEMLAGELPRVRTMAELLRGTGPRFVDPRAMRDGLPDDLATLCIDLLADDPERRPSGEEIAARLGARLDASRAGSQDEPLLPGAVARTGGDPGAVASSPRPLLVGREREAAILERALGRALDGHTVTALVHGTSGMGKTALVRAFLRDAATRHRAVVLAGRCFERESVPYKALDQLVDTLASHLVSLPVSEAEHAVPRNAAALARLFPVLDRCGAIRDAPRRSAEVDDPHELRRRGVAALKDLLGRLALRSPLVLHLDDLQWGDADSAALLLEALRPPDPPAVLVVAAYRSEDTQRSDFLASFLPARVREAEPEDSIEIAVGPLLHDDAKNLASALLAGREDGNRLLSEAIARESGGSPFFVHELVRYVLDAGGTGPVSMATVLADHFASLPEDARRLLEVVAVGGRPLSRRVAVAVAGVAGEGGAAVSRLAAGHLVRAVSAGQTPALEAHHDRIREAVLAGMDPERRAATHLAIAQELERASPEEVERLAHHYLEGRDRVRAMRHVESAAQRAATALAFDRAVVLYRRALDLVPEERRRDVSLALADALANAGHGRESAELFRRGAETAASADETLALSRRAAEQYLRSGHIDEGLAVVNELLARVGTELPRTPARALASVIFRRAQIALRGLRFEERPVERIPPQELATIDVLWTVGNGLGAVDMVRAADFQARHLLGALRAGEPYRIARALAWEGVLNVIEGGSARKKGIGLIATARSIAERIGHRHALAWASSGEAIVAWCEARWKDALPASERAIAEFREQPIRSDWEATSMTSLWWLPTMYFLGDLQAFRIGTRDCLEDARRRGDLYATTCVSLYCSPLVHLADDRPEEARREARAAIERWSTRHGWQLQHWMEWIAQMQIATYEGRAGGITDDIVRGSQLSERAMLLRQENIALITLQARARAWMAAAVERDSPELCKKAESDAKELGRLNRFGVAVAAGVRGALAAQRGDAATARAQLEAAARMYRELGMKLHAAAATVTIGRLVGGDEGRAISEPALLEMARLGARNPTRMSQLLAGAPTEAGRTSRR
ncbi:MAG: AAA family ATPase [Deltaproteobacteria bacterium]|nr:AAA family ATPase [Deltaproteobacteria bacterium]